MALSNLAGWNGGAASSSCGTACGAAAPEPEQAPAACGSACGAAAN